MQNLQKGKFSANIENSSLYVVTEDGTEILVDKDVEKIIKTEDSDYCYKVSYCKQGGRKADLYYSKESNNYKIFIESKKHIFWD